LLCSSFDEINILISDSKSHKSNTRNMESKDKILEYIKESGFKSYIHRVRKDPQVMNDIKPLLDSGYSMSEACYRYVYGSPGTCANNKEKKFKSFVEGFVFCGRAASCECAKKSVSANVSKTKATFTKEEIEASNTLREETNLKLYNVKNVSRTTEAAKGREEFRNDPNRVKQSQEDYKSTMLRKHGVDNGFKLAVVNDMRENDSPMRNPESVAKAKKTRTTNKAKNQIQSRVSNYTRIQNILEEHFVTLNIAEGEYLGVVKQYYEIKCLHCAHTWDSQINNGFRPYCKKCFPTENTYTSKEENELKDFLISMGVSVIQSERSLINPFELDLYLPDYNLAIEYCGLYWHSEKSSGKVSSYHKNKMQKCNAKGIRLITIFSDEWNTKKDLVKRMLMHILHRSNVNINARSCIIKEITAKETKPFLDLNHIQGAVGANTHLGLFHNEELVGVMTFGHLRSFMNRKTEPDSWEIRRIAFSGNVRGGASKLLSYFIKTKSPNKIISDADLRWSEGSIYKTLGFRQISESNSGYFWVEKYETRYHRVKFQKHKLNPTIAETGQSESQIMFGRGYDRIWDCGIRTYEWVK
jgi:hypothetical protein